jgi:CRISPR-associated protein (TIGR03984 family)
MGAAHPRASFEHAVALFYGLRTCAVGQVNASGDTLDAGGQLVDTGEVFEARVFSGTRELRWLATEGAGGTGRAALVSEEAGLGLTGWDARAVELEAADDRHGYLVWGDAAVALPAGGWARMKSRRLPAILVPVRQAVDAGAMLRITAVEYVATERKHGNRYIYDERLTGVALATG